MFFQPPKASIFQLARSVWTIFQQEKEQLPAFGIRFCWNLESEFGTARAQGAAAGIG